MTVFVEQPLTRAVGLQNKGLKKILHTGDKASLDRCG